MLQQRKSRKSEQDKEEDSLHVRVAKVEKLIQTANYNFGLKQQLFRKI
jgi:heme oxygenase